MVNKRGLRILIALALLGGLLSLEAPPAFGQCILTYATTSILDGSVIATDHGFVVDNCTISSTGIYAVFNNGLSGTISNNIISGGTTGPAVGILLGSGAPRSGPDPNVVVDVSGNTVSGYNKAGIVNGTYGTQMGGVTARVHNNVVTGSGPAGPGATWAQNGIQFGRLAQGAIWDNSVSGHFYGGGVLGSHGHTAL